MPSKADSNGTGKRAAKKTQGKNFWKSKKEFCQNPKCPNHHAIAVSIFKGTGACSINCRKALGDDVSSVGQHMFITNDEKKIIEESRNGRA